MFLPTNSGPADLSRAFEKIGPIVLGKTLEVTIGPDSAGAAVENVIAHGMGRVPIGWFELSPIDGATLVKQTRRPDETNLYLISSVPGVVATLWVF